MCIFFRSEHASSIHGLQIQPSARMQRCGLLRKNVQDVYACVHPRIKKPNVDVLQGWSLGKERASTAARKCWDCFERSFGQRVLFYVVPLQGLFTAPASSLNRQREVPEIGHPLQQLLLKNIGSQSL